MKNTIKTNINFYVKKYGGLMTKLNYKINNRIKASRQESLQEKNPQVY